MTPTTQATEYETTACGRCGGGGNYSYCQMYGTRCFGCAGTGKVYTKRGAAAVAYARKLRTVKAEEVQPGWLMWCAGGPLMKAGWFTVTRVGFDDGGRYMKDGEWLPYYMIETTQASHGTFPGAEVQAISDKSQLAAIKAQALAYQATLTKTGTVSKRRAA